MVSAALVHVLGQAEVTNLDDVVAGQEDVPAREVSVHHLLAGQVVHAASDLIGPADQVLGEQGLHGPKILHKM